MDLIKFFTRDEPIAGLDVNDSALRLVLLNRKTDKQRSVYIKEIAEEPLETGTIQAGILKDSAKFIAALKNLLSKSKTKINYLILSLPQTLTYSKIFYFPKVIEGEKLEEAMRAETQFNLPVAISNVYLDWEKTGTDRNELYLTTIPKAIIDSYVSALNSLKIQVVAAEPHLLSAIRVIDIDHAKPVALILPQTNGVLIVIVKNQSIRFSRLLPKNISEKDLASEMDRVSAFYEVEDEPISKTIKLESAGIVKKFADYGPIKDTQSAWLVAVGAALRGLLPRKNDTLVSLLPLGTEDAYEYQKSVIFTKFVTKIVISLSILFTLSFVFSWILVVYLRINLGERIAHLATEPIPPNTAVIEKRVTEFNSLVAKLADIVKRLPNWSKPLEELKSAVGSAIVITSFNVPAVNQEFKITGIGKTRNDINLFKKRLDELSLYTNVKLNINAADIIKKEDISFDASLRLKNPDQLYVQ